MNRNHRAEWLRQRRRGVFCHYLADQQSPRGRNASSEEWNELVDHFDVSGLARQLHRVGAGYFFITLGQTSGHYIAPNAVYDEIVQMPGRCSRRDLVLDLAGELAKYDIPLLVYIPSDFSCNDPVAAAVWRMVFAFGFIVKRISHAGLHLLIRKSCAPIWRPPY